MSIGRLEAKGTSPARCAGSDEWFALCFPADSDRNDASEEHQDSHARQGRNNVAGRCQEGSEDDGS